MGDSDGTSVSVGPDDPYAAFAEDLRKGGGSYPQPSTGGDTRLSEGGSSEGGVDEHFGHRDRPSGVVF